MDSEWPKGRKVAAFAAIAFMFLQLVVFPMMAPQPLPALGEGAELAATYFAARKMTFLIGNYLGVLGILPGVITTAYLGALLRKREGDGGFLWMLVLSSGLVALTVGAVDLIIFQAVPFLAAPGLEVGAKALSDLSEAAFALMFLPVGLFTASFAWAIFSTKVLPRWTAVFALFVTAVGFVASLGSIWTTKPLVAGGPLTSLALVLFSTWFGSLAVPLLRARASSAFGPNGS